MASSELERPAPTLHANNVPQDNAASTPTVNETSDFAKTSRGRAFWLSFSAIVVTNLLSALDLTAIATILPTLTADLNGGDEFTWVGSAYALSSTAILPLIGGLADSFGRKPVMVCCVVLFAIGSALAASAKTMHWMIGARSGHFPLFVYDDVLSFQPECSRPGSRRWRYPDVDEHYHFRPCSTFRTWSLSGCNRIDGCSCFGYWSADCKSLLGKNI